MKPNKWLFIASFFMLLVFTSMFFSSANASSRVFEREYIYVAGDVDSKISSRIIAIEQVKRILLEELGTALISETVVTNGRLTKDQIVAFSAGIVKMTIVQEHWDGKTFRLKARMEADPEEVVRFVQGVLSDQKKARQLSTQNRQTLELTTEIETLKAEIREKPDSEKVKRYEEAVAKLTAFEWFKKAIEAIDKVNLGDERERSKHKAKIIESIDALDNVIVQIPDFSIAYQCRGLLYLYGLEEYAKAIADFDSALSYNNWNVKGITFKEIAPEEISDIQVTIIQMKAYAQFKLGKYVDCLNTLEKGLRIRPGSLNFSKGFEWKETDLNLLVKKYPKDYRSWIYRGIYFSSNRIIEDEKYAESALRDFPKALTLNKREPLIYYFLADTLLSAFFQFDQKGEYKVGRLQRRSNALKYLEQASKLPLSAITGKLIYKLKANALTDSKDYAGAFKAYDKALEYSKDDGGIHIDKASLYLRISKYTEAISEYDKAMSASHKEYARSYGNDFTNMVYLFRADANLKAGNINEAVTDFSKYIEAKKTDTLKANLDPLMFTGSAYRDRGNAYLALGKYHEAVDDLTNALKGWLPDLRTYQYRAQAYAKLGDYEAALRDYNQFIKLWRDDKIFKPTVPHNFYLERGLVYVNLKRYKEAIDDLNAALELEPDNLTAIMNRGLSYFYLGINDQALKDLGVAMLIAPNNPSILVFHGNALLASGRIIEAIKDFDQAIELDPKNDMAYYSRGVANSAIGFTEKSIRDYRIAARLGNEVAKKYLQDNKLTW